MSDSVGDSKSRLAAIRAGIGDRLRRVREKLNESQTRFAERMGVAKLAVLTYESGESCPRADQLALLTASGVDASFVAFGVPSLATPQARQQFAAALAWVKHESAVSALDVSEAGLVEAAWLVFTELNRPAPDQMSPDNEALRDRAIRAVQSIAP